MLTALGGCNDKEPEKQIGPGPAQLVFQLAKLRHEIFDGCHSYVHSRRYSESIGQASRFRLEKGCVELGNLPEHSCELSYQWRGKFGST